MVRPKKHSSKSAQKKKAIRAVRFSVATSLDGFIAGPNDEADWIIMDPAFDFSALFQQFDTLLIGRRTFELMQRGGTGTMPGMTTIVVSRTLNPRDFPKLAIARDLVATVQALKQKQGKDIWLFGGGSLFRSALDAGVVDTIELAVVPILLSDGVPLLPRGARSPALHLMESRALPSGIVLLTYGVKQK